MNRRAVVFADAMRTWLDTFGPGLVRSVSVQRVGAWVVTKLGATSDETARILAADLGLSQARTQQRGRSWWREYVDTAEGVMILVVGPAHAIQKEDWPRSRAGALPR